MTKKLLLLLITLTTFTNVSYASFPVIDIIETKRPDPGNIIALLLGGTVVIYLGYLLNKVRVNAFNKLNKTLALLGMIILVLFSILVLIVISVVGLN